MLFYRVTFGEAEDIWGRTAIWIGRKAIWTAIKKYFVRKTNYDSGKSYLLKNTPASWAEIVEHFFAFWSQVLWSFMLNKLY